ncbi:cation:proton antiporter [Streptomyces vilmorinianum]|uniref:cation:proton antiporter n=1 Tax=Streptomyces vilmorinianum TaxID=3051092 RepID=UPI0010FB8FD5|nr:cation:proton antiporter [Streptomyces vilmorinianum]
MAASEGVPLDAIVLADVAVVLVVGAVMVRLGRRLHQPPVVAEIAAGLMLGPSLLGLLPGDLPALIFPPEARPGLSALAQLGLALFMFSAGWELDLRALRGRTRSVGSTAFLAMAVPFAVGAGAAALLYRSTAPDGVGADMFVLYMATAFSITAFPVLARIIRDRRLGHTRVGSTAMACAAAGDVVAWCVLVLVVALAGAGAGKGAGTGGFFTVIALTVAYAAGMLFVVRPLLHRALRSAAGGRQETGVRLVLIVSGVLLSSYATSWIGIHAIFGAFAFGLVMPRAAGPELHRQVAVPLEKASSLLLPVFFVITGLSVDIGGLGRDGLFALLVVLVAAVAGKFAGAAIPARLSGMSWRDAGAFGTLMNTRGLTEIVILGIGRQMGLIGPELFTGMVVMALVTTAMAGPLLRLLGVGEDVTRVAPVPDQSATDRKETIGAKG